MLEPRPLYSPARAYLAGLLGAAIVAAEGMVVLVLLGFLLPLPHVVAVTVWVLWVEVQVRRVARSRRRRPLGNTEKMGVAALITSLVMVFVAAGTQALQCYLIIRAVLAATGFVTDGAGRKLYLYLRADLDRKGFIAIDRKNGRAVWVKELVEYWPGEPVGAFTHCNDYYSASDLRLPEIEDAEEIERFSRDHRFLLDKADRIRLSIKATER